MPSLARSTASWSGHLSGLKVCELEELWPRLPWSFPRPRVRGHCHIRAHHVRRGHRVHRGQFHGSYVIWAYFITKDPLSVLTVSLGGGKKQREKSFPAWHASGIVEIPTAWLKGDTLDLTSARFISIMWNTVQLQVRIAQRMMSTCHFACQICLAARYYRTYFTLIMMKSNKTLDMTWSLAVKWWYN